MRQRILNLLHNQFGEYVSGEEISQKLNITRAAVWKQIKVLKDLGYEIEAQTKKGYRLIGEPKGIDEWAVENRLETMALGRNLKVFDKLSSTNDYAKEWARQGAPHGAVVISKMQSSGRGRMGRLWESPLGGIWMSIILKPNLELAEAAKITLSAGIALAESFNKLYDIEAKIKWPNDIVCHGHKIAGILGEVVGEWNTVKTIILGIGINANFKREQLNPEFPATTLLELLGHEVNLNTTVARFLLELEKEIVSLENKDTIGLKERWLKNSIGVGTQVIVAGANEKWQGIYKGITDTGELILEHNGRLLSFSSGDVKLRAPNQYSP